MLSNDFFLNFRLKGNLIGDYCLGMICAFCVSLQIYKELKFRGEILSENDRVIIDLLR